MPLTFYIPGPLREFTEGQSKVEIECSGTTLADALSALWIIYPGLRDRIATEQGEIREHINVFIGDSDIRFTGGLTSRLSEGSDISIVPSISGGARREEIHMNQKQLRTTFGQPTPELPVEDVERAQQYYRDVLGFEIGWLYPGGDIGAVSRDNAVIFFRRRSRPFEPAVHWVFAADIDATLEELRSQGAQIVEPLEKKPWGLRQFTVEDIDGNRFYFHCD